MLMVTSLGLANRPYSYTVGKYHGSARHPVARSVATATSWPVGARPDSQEPRAPVASPWRKATDTAIGGGHVTAPNCITERRARTPPHVGT